MFWSVILLICLPALEGNESLKNRKIKVDKKHLDFDFSSILGPIAAIFGDSEMDFRYFAVHDYDNNNKLDGLELFIALGHDSGHEHTEPGIDINHTEDIEKQVDDIIEGHDGNNDGFLDFKEFMSVQRVYPDLGKGAN